MESEKKLRFLLSSYTHCRDVTCLAPVAVLSIFCLEGIVGNTLDKKWDHQVKKRRRKKGKRLG